MPRRFTRTGGVYRLDLAHIAVGDLESPNLQCFFVYPEMYLAPDAALWATILARVPLAFPLDLDPGAVDQQVQRPRVNSNARCLRQVSSDGG